MADVPCGTGRWWPQLAKRAGTILAFDISEGMREHARARAEGMDGVRVEVREGDAESLELEDGSVDWLFSFALTKHLPVPVQYAVLREFARVSRSGVICSFGIFTHLSYEVWRRRNRPESYPVNREEVSWMAEHAGLSVESVLRCSTPIGVEHVVAFRKLA
jgi:ubiquinone/menaquinone biosynthesis C-methylase UbiE